MSFPKPVVHSKKIETEKGGFERWIATRERGRNGGRDFKCVLVRMRKMPNTKASKTKKDPCHKFVDVENDLYEAKRHKQSPRFPWLIAAVGRKKTF